MNALNLRAAALQSADRMPFVTSVLQRALALFSHGEDVSVKELADVIEEDVVIAGGLLSIANSAMYNRGGALSSLRQAIARLGTNKTRHVLLGLSISRSFRKVRLPGNALSSIQFNAHSLATATLSDLIVQRIPAANSEWAFMAGLLHDVGLLLIAAGLPGRFLEIMEAESDYQLIEKERELIGFTHFDLGADLMVRWNFPDFVQDAIRFCETDTFEYEEPMTLGMVVKTASLMADACAISIVRSEQNPTFVPELLEALGIESPSHFVEMFQTEYIGLQSCVA